MRDEKNLNFISTIHFLSKYLKGYHFQFVAFYIGWFLQSAINVVGPLILGVMIDQIIYCKNITLFIKIAEVFVMVTIFSCILYYFIYQIYAYILVMFTFEIKKDVFSHLLDADAQYMASANTGSLITAIQVYTNECMNFVVRNLIHNINGILMIAFCTIYIFMINCQIGILAVISVPIGIYITYKYGKKIRVYGEESETYYNSFVSWLYEMLTGLRDIRLLNAQNVVNRTFTKKHKKMFAVNVKSITSTLTAENIINGSNLLIQLVMFTFIALFSKKYNITVGMIVVILAYYNILTKEVGAISNKHMDAQNRISYIQHIYDFMQVPVEKNFDIERKIKVTNGNISINNITFSYNFGEKIISDLSLNINEGEKIAIVGESGCGKTTLSYMMIGFYQPQNGYIEIDGQKLCDCSLQSIRQNIGIVQQDVLLFDGTIKENLLFGNPKATDDELESACRLAGITNFCKKLPDSINTVIGSKGVALSGGEKQRIAIARIYLKNPKIIIFDEATSALDSDTEMQIHKSWKQALDGRTVIVIAHRQSSVMLCDKVAIMEKGKIIEVGSPLTMVNESSKFRNLFAVKDGKQIC
jgi:ATP-binding cassette subfamily B protein